MADPSMTSTIASGAAGQGELTAGALRDWQLCTRTGVALVLTTARYWTSVAPIVGREIKRWERHAQSIDDPALRALALSKLRREGFNADAAAMLATLAPRAHRAKVVEAIVALELLFDYLDGLTELPCADPIRDGERLFAALTDAVAVASSGGTQENSESPVSHDEYLCALSGAVKQATAGLPAISAVTPTAIRIAQRSAQAQIRMHAAAELGCVQLRDWAKAEASGSGFGWREFLAGAASSVLVLHALIAAAANPDTTTVEAAEIASAYVATCVLLTLLDGLVDHEHDVRREASGATGYLGLYDDPTELVDLLGRTARNATLQARARPEDSQRVMVLVGAVAYYGSSPGAQGELAQPVVGRLRQELAPLISPTLAVMRAWRRARWRRRLSRARREGWS